LGEIIPADARLIEDSPLEVDQSALTGESLPVPRNQGDVVYSGSVVKKGEAEALVYATGTKTFFGKTAQLVESAHTVSHFQKAVLRIGDYLIILAIALVGFLLEDGVKQVAYKVLGPGQPGMLGRMFSLQNAT
jgi:H+-transporting ATPase